MERTRAGESGKMTEMEGGEPGRKDGGDRLRWRTKAAVCGGRWMTKYGAVRAAWTAGRLVWKSGAV